MFKKGGLLPCLKGLPGLKAVICTKEGRDSIYSLI